MDSPRRTIIGFCLAFFASLSALLLAVIAAGPRNELLLPMLVPYLLIGGIVVATSLAVGGLPLLLILERLRYRKLWPYLAGSVVLSAVFVFLFKPFGRDAIPSLVQQAAVCSSIGAVGAFVLWFSVVRRGAKNAN
ncbi:hypothetical protein [uncultured Abyssibacter sp.]|uniref:hypothetical protein n=1 Tax=uncultured Abyssibacter sp. TaxID=2320202 RepID=UPI0032B1ACAD